MKGILLSNRLACKLLQKVAILKPKIKNEDFWNSNGDIESGYLLTHRASLPAASLLQHISGDIAQKSGVSVTEIVGALYAQLDFN